MCLCARILALEWNERARKSELQMFFVDFRPPYWCTITIHQHGVSIHSSTKVREMFRQITQKLYGGPQRLGQMVSSLFFVPYSLRHWQWKRSITVYLLACVAGAWKYWAKVRTGAREGDKRGVSPLSPSVSPSRAPLFSCAHYFQTPTTQAVYLQIYESLFKAFLLPQWKRYHVYYDEPFNTAKYLDARWRSQTRYNLRQQW